MNQQFNDPLVQCLIALGRHHGSSTTAEALVSGLPLVDGLLTPRLFPRAAERLGLACRRGCVKVRPDIVQVTRFYHGLPGPQQNSPSLAIAQQPPSPSSLSAYFVVNSGKVLEKKYRNNSITPLGLAFCFFPF